MWPFPARIVDDATVEWQLQAFEWLLTELGDEVGLAGSRLVVPGLGDFVADGETGHDLAQRILDQIRAYVRMDAATRIELLQQDGRRESIVNERTALVHDRPEPLGTCVALEDGSWAITYDPALLDNLEGLIATLTHEIAHVLVPQTDNLPVEADEYEFLIDLCVAFLGFGVFLANARSERLTDGAWTWWRGGGYLPINDCLMATALFIAVKGDNGDRTRAEGFLQQAWQPAFRKAFRQLRRFEAEVERLRLLDRRLTVERSAGRRVAESV